MGHQIVEAVLEDGQIKSTNKKLPRGKMKVHLIFDNDVTLENIDISEIIAETSGIYKGINTEKESRELRLSWERNVSD